MSDKKGEEDTKPMNRKQRRAAESDVQKKANKIRQANQDKPQWQVAFLDPTLGLTGRTPLPSSSNKTEVLNPPPIATTIASILHPTQPSSSSSSSSSIGSTDHLKKKDRPRCASELFANEHSADLESDEWPNRDRKTSSSSSSSSFYYPPSSSSSSSKGISANIFIHDTNTLKDVLADYDAMKHGYHPDSTSSFFRKVKPNDLQNWTTEVYGAGTSVCSDKASAEEVLEHSNIGIDPAEYEGYSEEYKAQCAAMEREIRKMQMKSVSRPQRVMPTVAKNSCFGFWRKKQTLDGLTKYDYEDADAVIENDFLDDFFTNDKEDSDKNKTKNKIKKEKKKKKQTAERKVLPFPEPGDKETHEINTVFIRELTYLQSMQQGVGYLGFSTCRLCGKANGSSEYMCVYTTTNTQYVWPEGYLHYVQDHRVPPPAEIVDAVHTMYTHPDNVRFHNDHLEFKAGSVYVEPYMAVCGKRV